jgi:hypothetical protein
MAEKRESLEDLARKESQAEQELADQRAGLLVNQQRLAKEVPVRFFKLCDELKAAVMRFNTACDPQKRIVWRESAALAARDTNLNADFNLSFERPGASIMVVLNNMGRANKPDAFIMEAHGTLKNDGFMLRVEGFVRGKEIDYRISVNFKKSPYGIEELADRLVKSVVKVDLNQLIQS